MYPLTHHLHTPYFLWTKPAVTKVLSQSTGPLQTSRPWVVGALLRGICWAWCLFAGRGPCPLELRLSQGRVAVSSHPGPPFTQPLPAGLPLPRASTCFQFSMKCCLASGHWLSWQRITENGAEKSQQTSLQHSRALSGVLLLKSDRGLDNAPPPNLDIV